MGEALPSGCSTKGSVRSRSSRARWEGSGPNLIDDDHGKRRRMPSGFDASADRRSKCKSSGTRVGNRSSMERGRVLKPRASALLKSDTRT